MDSINTHQYTSILYQNMFLYFPIMFLWFLAFIPTMFHLSIPPAPFDWSGCPSQLEGLMEGSLAVELFLQLLSFARHQTSDEQSRSRGDSLNSVFTGAAERPNGWSGDGPFCGLHRNEDVTRVLASW